MQAFCGDGQASVIFAGFYGFGSRWEQPRALENLNAINHRVLVSLGSLPLVIAGEYNQE